MKDVAFFFVFPFYDKAIEKGAKTLFLPQGEGKTQPPRDCGATVKW